MLYHINTIYYTPSKQIVCPSVRLSVQPCPVLSYGETLKVLTSQNRKIAYNLRACHDNWIRSETERRKRALFMSSPYFLYRKRLEVVTALKDCLWPESVSWFWPKVIRASLRSLKEKKFIICVCVMLFLWRNIGSS